MFTVKFSSNVVDHVTGLERNGWLDPQWSMWEVCDVEDDPRVWEFETLAEALEFADSEIGSLEVETTERGNYYAADSRVNVEDGEVWYDCAHVEEV